MKLFLRAAALSVCLCVAVPAQDVPLRATSPLVVVPVSVRDKKGNRIGGLTAADFTLTDRGRPVEFRLEEESSPISVAVLVQTNRIAAPALSRLERNVSLLGPLVAGWDAEAALFTYDSEVRPLLPFTQDLDKVEGAMVTLQARSGLDARLHDALLLAANELKARRPRRRRVLLVIGESRDRGSQTRLEDAVAALQLSNTAVYWLSYSAMMTGLMSKAEDRPEDAPATNPRTQTSPQRPSPVEGPPGPPTVDLGGLMREGGRSALPKSSSVLTKSTGGFEAEFTRSKGLEDALARIGQELHMQYVLTFRPSPASGAEWRELVVKIPARKDARLRHRPGYFIEPE